MPARSSKRHVLGVIAVAALFASTAALGDNNARPVLIGLDADMSGNSALSSEAIRRGVILAIDEINARGGLLGRPLKLVVRDHRGIPARGVDNIEDFAEQDDLVAVVGGIHTPVALAELETTHRHKMIYLGPWAAGTPIVANNYRPNFVFRVSVRDEHAGGFLIDAARQRGFKRPGLLLWRTGWGRSNEKAMTAAMARFGMTAGGVQWFNTGQKDITEQINALAASGSDVIMLVANPGDGLVAVRNIAGMPVESRLPIISHWGITGGDFFKQAHREIAAIDLSFLQTFSFHRAPFPNRAEALFASYCRKFGSCSSHADVFAPVGTAHAYDLVRMLARAVKRAGTIDRRKVRASLETLARFDGVMRNYRPPFTAQRHDALDARDFRLARFDASGAIIPVSPN